MGGETTPSRAVVRSAGHAYRLKAAMLKKEFLALATKVPVKTTVEILRLDQANEALSRLREGRITGAAVLVP